MEIKYRLEGMTCGSCVAVVKKSLEGIHGVKSAEVLMTSNEVVLEVEKPILHGQLQANLPSKYKIFDTQQLNHKTQLASLFATYKPIIFIFLYIAGVSFLVQIFNEQFFIETFMRHFMSGFFLVFSFFKMLDLKNFASSYKMYDIGAKIWPKWAYLYVFVELVLGIAYLINFNPTLTNAVTFFVMSFSIIGVILSLVKKQTIRCACLGAVFNLPMSKITLAEDAIMILMSGYMLIQYLF